MAYETARRALEAERGGRSAFAIAHATLARAYDELDYTERAKDSMLRAVAAAQVAADARGAEAPRDAVHGLAGLSARGPTGAADRGGVGRSRSTRCCPGVGLARPVDGRLESATAAFRRALALNPSLAAARLRLGFMFGRQEGKTTWRWRPSPTPSISTGRRATTKA